MLSFWLLQFYSVFAYASLKRNRETLTDSGLEDEIRDILCDIDKPAKIQRVEQNIFNLEGVSYKASSPELLQRITDFYPTGQAKMLAASHSSKEIFSKFPFYQMRLAEQLGMDGFKRIPMHSDLKIFEVFQFDSSPMGKAGALNVLFKIVFGVLTNSSIRIDVLGVVCDEAARLAERDLEAYNTFLTLTEFYRKVKTTTVCSLLINAGKLKELVTFSQFWPELARDTQKALSELPVNEFYRIVPVLGNYFYFNPEHFEFLFPGDKISAKLVTCLLCSMLPMEAVNSLLHNGNDAPSALELYECVFEVLQFTFDSIFPDEAVLASRLLDFIDYAEMYRLAIIDAEDALPSVDYVEVARFLIKCRFENFLTTQEGHETFKSLDRLDHNLVRTSLCTILILRKRFEHAIYFLPREADTKFAQIVSKSPDFCALLVKLKPDIVRSYYKDERKFLSSNRNLIFTFFSVASLNELLMLSEPKSRYNFAFLVYSQGSNEEIRQFLDMLGKEALRLLYTLLFTLDIDASRFAEILQIYLSYVQSDPSIIFNGLKRLYEVKPEAIVVILEWGGVDMLAKLYEICSSEENFLNSNLLLDILFKSNALHSRILPFKNQLIARFSNKEVQFSLPLYSPYDIHTVYRFLNFDFAEYIRNVLKYLFRNSGHDFVSYFLALISLSRVWYSIDPEVANYSGEDFCAPTLKDQFSPAKEITASIYSTLTPLGKTILMHLFSILHQVKMDIGAEDANNEDDEIELEEEFEI